MMKIARRLSSIYAVYNIFEIEESTYLDIKNSLIDKELYWKHKSIDKEGQEILIFGSTAFKIKN